MRCLTLLAACPTAEGAVLEIGSYKGRSTVILALAAARIGEPAIVAADPLQTPEPHLQSMYGTRPAWDEFQANLARTGLADKVEFHRTTSHELARAWPVERKLRLLFIDGDHTYPGAKADFDLFAPHLADGGIVALHDTINAYGGPSRVFAEDVLLSPHFGAAGVCGSVGWSQYHREPATATRHRDHKLRLYRRLSRLVSYNAFGGPLTGWRKLAFKIARSRVPRGTPELEAFRGVVTLP